MRKREYLVSKPHLSAWQICNICIGAFGIQFGFALPQANATRIFQNLGASLDNVPLLWLAGPITGLIVQPLVGYYSDRTWTRYGRRRPYFLFGAALAAGALIAMPNATTLWMAVLMLWLLDASLNLTMGPYRAFVADEMSAEQRSNGYLTYMSFASVGAVVGSLLPWMFVQFGTASGAPAGEVSDAVRYAFYVGATLLLSAVCWSAFTSREYSPDLLAKFDDPAPERVAGPAPEKMRRHGWIWLALGSLGWLLAWWLSARGAMYVLVGAALVYGLFLLAASRMRSDNAFTSILGDMESMTTSMRWLAVVQFCSWFALFALFMYAAPAVARMHYGAPQPGTAGYEAGANWVGVLFATFYAVAAIAALVIPFFVRRFGMSLTHRINLWVGAAGLMSMMLIHEHEWLLISMLGLGFAWASIVSLPYAMLANNLPARKMGLNIGIFNIFIVIPQLLAVGVMSWLLDTLADGDPSFAFAIGAVAWFLAGLAVLRVRDTAAPDVRATL
jgi:maltose/moltooligosaccharide transporter